MSNLPISVRNDLHQECTRKEGVKCSNARPVVFGAARGGVCMSPRHSVNLPPGEQSERHSVGSLIPVNRSASETKAVIASRQIYALMAYYMALLIGSIALIVFVIVQDGSLLKDASTSEDNKRVLASIAFLGEWSHSWKCIISDPDVVQILYQNYRF